MTSSCQKLTTMNVNFSTIARQRTRPSRKLSNNPHDTACKTRGFCTRSVGPPANVQNYSHRKECTVNTLRQHSVAAHQNVPCKSQKTPSAGGFCSKTPKSSAQSQHSKPTIVPSPSPQFPQLKYKSLVSVMIADQAQ